MSKDDAINLVMLGVPPVLLVVATPQFVYPWNGLLWLVYAFAAMLWAIYRFPTFQRWRSLPNSKKPMTLLIVASTCGLIGAVAGTLAWCLFPSGETIAANALRLRVAISGRHLGDDVFFYQPIAITNQSDERMNLSFRLHFQDKNATDQIHAAYGEWHDWGPKFGNYRETPGQEILTLDDRKTVRGHLVFDVPKPAIPGTPEWELEPVCLEILDRGSGKRAYGHPHLGYPPAVKPRLSPLSTPEWMPPLDY